MPKIIGYLIVAFWFASMCANGQRYNLIDSVEFAMEPKDGIERINHIVDVAVELVDKDNEGALALIEHAERLAGKLEDSMSIAECMRLKGQILARLQRSEEAIKMLQFSLSISERHRFEKERLSALVSIGVVYIKRSQYDKSLHSLTVAYDLAVSQMDTASMEAALNNLGVVYYKLKDYEKALFNIK